MRDWGDSTCWVKSVWDGSKWRGAGEGAEGDAWEKWPEGEAAKAAQEEEEKSGGGGD